MSHGTQVLLMNRWSKLFGKNPKDSSPSNSTNGQQSASVESPAVPLPKPGLSPISTDDLKDTDVAEVYSTPVRELSRFTKTFSEAKSFVTGPGISSGASTFLSTRGQSVAAALVRTSSSAASATSAGSPKNAASPGIQDPEVIATTGRTPERELIKRMSNLVRSSSNVFTDEAPVSLPAPPPPLMRLPTKPSDSVSDTGVSTARRPQRRSSSFVPDPLIQNLAQLNKTLEAQISRAESQLSQCILEESSDRMDRAASLNSQIDNLKKTLKATKDTVAALKS
jgi:hypothetical protein